MRKIRWFFPSSLLLLFNFARLSSMSVLGAKLVCNNEERKKEEDGNDSDNDDNNNVVTTTTTCHFEVGYDELAETFSDLNCVTSTDDNGQGKLKCSFEVDKIKQHADSSPTTEETTTSTSTTSSTTTDSSTTGSHHHEMTSTTVATESHQILVCSENDEVCLHSFFQTHLIKSSSTRITAATTTAAEDYHSTPQHQKSQQQQQQQQTDPQETQQQHRQQQQQRQKAPPASNDNNDDGGGIRVGHYVYREPYSQYAGPIERTLRHRSSLLLQHQKKGRQQHDDIGLEYSIANSYFDLGIAHFTAVTQEDYSPGMHSGGTTTTTTTTTTNVLPESFDLKLAVNAFEMTEKLYTNILLRYDREKPTLYKSFGSLYLQWGEVYQNSNYFDDDDISYHTISSDPYLQQQEEFNKFALKRYQQSEKYYRLALEELSRGDGNAGDDDASSSNNDGDPAAVEQEQDQAGTTTTKQQQQQESSRSSWMDLNDKTTKDIEINLAHVTHRIGRCLINSIQGTAVMAEDLQLDQTVDLSDAIPQLKTLMHTVPQAEDKFAEAIRLFRNANEKETDFDAQNRLKMNLATSLQDGGTAASYASNLPKSIEYQEEGVAISKEILSHVSQSDRYYLTQYIADSMYGLSNHYMQLGQYDKTKSTYRYTMDWYEEHNLNPATTAPPAAAVGYDMTDATVEAYEKQLSDYHELIREYVTMPDGYVEDGQPQYGPNKAYEAELHAGLGTLHLSREEVLMAIEHFNQAILLYQKHNNESDENLDRSIADVKVSLAAAYFKDGEFASSAEVHNEAMDIYKVEVGEGKNPLLAGLAEKLSGTIDLNDVVASSELGELFGGGDIQELLAGMGVDTTELTAKIEELTKEKDAATKAKGLQDDEKDQGQPAEKINNNNNNNAKGKPEKEAQKVHEELINADIIEKVRQSILNATSMRAEL